MMKFDDMDEDEHDSVAFMLMPPFVFAENFD